MERGIRQILREIVEEHLPGPRGAGASSGPGAAGHSGAHEPGHHAAACACGWYGDSYADHLAESLEVEIYRRGLQIGQLHP